MTDFPSPGPARIEIGPVTIYGDHRIEIDQDWAADDASREFLRILQQTYLARAIDDDQIDLEMAYAVQPHLHDDCRNPYNPDVVCRRTRGHDGNHAAGHRPHRIRWENQ